MNFTDPMCTFWPLKKLLRVLKKGLELNMDTNSLAKVILMPHVSEKSVMIADNIKQQTFKVASNASKNDVKEAIEKLFDVEVIKVNILTVRGKKKVFGRTIGRRKNYKKAYVTLKEGQDIEDSNVYFFDGYVINVPFFKIMIGEVFDIFE